MNSVAQLILAINAGSSTLRFALFHGNDLARAILRGKIDRIDPSHSRWTASHLESGTGEIRNWKWNDAGVSV